MSHLTNKMRVLQELLAAGKSEQAIVEIRKMLARDPGDPGLCNAMASALVTQGNFDQAAYFARTGLVRAGSDAFLLQNFGAILSACGKKDEARAPLRRAAELEPRNVPALVAAARITWETGGASEAMAMLERARAFAPQDFRVAALFAEILVSQGRAREGFDLATRLIASAPTHRNLAAMAANVSNYIEGVEPARVRRLHQHFGSLVEAAAQAEVGNLPPPARTDQNPGRRLRVGLLSFDLTRHSVGFFLEAMLRHLDRSRFEIVAFFTGPADERTSVLRPLCDEWREVGTLPDWRIAERIRAERIDVLIETSGLTLGHRLGVMAMRPAPVLATYLGYPNTTGVRAVRHRIVDAITDPPWEESHCVERLERLNGCFLCYTPPSFAPEPAPRDPAAPIVFGSFNAAHKISDGLPTLWASVLDAVPGSRLVLKSRDFKDPVIAGTVRERFARTGLPGDRVELLAPDATQREHLARYAGIDIALDTFPYHGTTTTCEALWMGVPVVTLRGPTHASRVGASLLHAAGLDEWIAQAPENYVAIAARLAQDRSALASLRAGLRARVAASELCDGAAYARRMGVAIESIWREWCNGGAS